MEPLIKVNNVNKYFHDPVEIQVLKNISFTMNQGEFVSIMGKSGCGKSTLLYILSTMDTNYKGQLFLADRLLTGLSGNELAVVRNEQIGFVFQQFALYSHLTVLENVTLALKVLEGMKKPEANEKALETLSKFDMSIHQNKYPSQLSGGQQQRVAIARALAMDPAVLVLDEPTSALDPIMSRDVADLINRLHEAGITMLCVTHDLALAQNISDTVMFLDKGVIRADEKISILMSDTSDPDIHAFFGNKDAMK